MKSCKEPRHRVNRILDAFKSGSRGSAAIRIERGGKFIDIRCLPAREGDRR